jgi:hypothetical protein
VSNGLEFSKVLQVEKDLRDVVDRNLGICILDFLFGAYSEGPWARQPILVEIFRLIR